VSCSKPYFRPKHHRQSAAVLLALAAVTASIYASPWFVASSGDAFLMAAKGLKRFRIAAWLGLVALGIQALIPALLAVEIRMARAEGGHAVVALCIHGQAVSRHDADGPSHAPGSDENGSAVCPICVALQASPAFTAPAPVILPLPAIHYVATAVVVPQPAVRSVTAAAYRSRAPPSV
jgi:hypothetical protein